MNATSPPGVEPVVITGVGAVSPLGCTFAEIAANLIAGRSGVRAVDPGEYGREPVQFAGPVPRIPNPPAATCVLAAEDFARLDRLEQMCLAPLALAIADAGVLPRERGQRGSASCSAWERSISRAGNSTFSTVARACSTRRATETLVHRLAGRLGIAGPAVTVAAACASSGYAMAMGRTWIDSGWVDACLVGGCDILSPTAIAAFYNLRALSRRSDDPAKASRPFDRDRDGFVMAEGGAFFLLERQADARGRGARIRGELAGVGMSSDAAHMVIPSVDPTQAARAISAALADAGVRPDEVDYVNAHAAGTPVGDVAEAGAIRIALGDATDAVPVSSTKSMSGHLVSGAAAFEARRLPGGDRTAGHASHRQPRPARRALPPRPRAARVSPAPRARRREQFLRLRGLEPVPRDPLAA